MLPRQETPLERIEADIAWLKGLPDIATRVRRPTAVLHLGPWDGLHEHCKFLFLSYLDWSGIDAADYQCIMAREVKPYDIFDCYRRKGEECD